MKPHWHSILLAFFAALIFVTACSSGSTPATSSSTAVLDGATLVQERCSRCHPLTHVEGARHTAAEWKIIVGTMVSRGAQLTPQEETIVVSWLAANYGK